MCVRYITNDILPFPSYMYRSCIAKKVSFEISEGGKYCDSTFIIKIIKLGYSLLDIGAINGLL